MSEITGTTKLACLLGSPVSHSISPLIHNFSFQYLGIDCTYLAFDINEQTLKEAVEGLKALHVLGFNLTMPNKNKILEYLDGLSDAARLIGAVNTVENRDGRLIGHNTDGLGFMRRSSHCHLRSGSSGRRKEYPYFRQEHKLPSSPDPETSR